MKKFKKIIGIAAPFTRIKVDTDIIIPAESLKTITRKGLGKDLFSYIRFNEDGSENKKFILNQPDYRNAEILVTGKNFGCGSSREHAPWALSDFGIKCIISSSFADIFYNNCFKNGILPITLSEKEVEKLLDQADDGSNAIFSVDLAEQTVKSPRGEILHFEIDQFRKHCLINGLDDIGLTLEKSDLIEAFEERRLNTRPWL